MKSTGNNGTTNFWIVAAAFAVIFITASACSHLGMMFDSGAARPAENEFGLGPRTSPTGIYTATIEISQPLKPRRMQTMQLEIRDAAGRPVEAATITVDGGMPEHGHGLPTQPRVTRHLGNGIYTVEGVRFNMGGWWELEFGITTPMGTETVTFNLAL